MVQYYTLEEAANLLHLSAEKLKDMVKKNEVRAFQDRGTLRFRRQEIDELVRVRGLGSDPELQLGDPPPASASASPSSRKRSKVEPATFNFADEVPLADNPPSGAQKSGGQPSSLRRKTTAPKSPPPRSPYPRGASDSNVRLVSEGEELDFRLEVDDAPAKPRTPGPAGKTGLSKRSPRPRTTTAASESKVPALPPILPEDSDVKIEGEAAGDSMVPLGQPKGKTPSDSDIRLEGDPLAELGGGDKRAANLITEEIDLDAEQARIDEARQKAQDAAAKARQTEAPPVLPTSSPFELSDNDLGMALVPDVDIGDESASKGGDSSGDYELTPPESKGVDSSNDFVLTEPSPELKGVDSSGDFEVKPPESKGVDSSNDFVLTEPDASSPLELGSDEVPKLTDGSDESEVTLGDLSAAGAGKSGINLQDAADSGLSLEEPGSNDDLDFNLSLDAGNTPRPSTANPRKKRAANSSSACLMTATKRRPQDGSDSEFELTLDEGSSELELETESSTGSDSEFELTLDEEGALGGEDTSSVGEEEGKDIFETDFDVPALDEESGSQAGFEEGTDLESSEFELTLDEDGGSVAEETGTEDFAIEEDEPESFVTEEDEEEAEPAPRRRTRTSRVAEEGEDDDGIDLSLDEDEVAEAEEEEAEMVWRRRRRAARRVGPAAGDRAFPRGHRPDRRRPDGFRVGPGDVGLPQTRERLQPGARSDRAHDPRRRCDAEGMTPAARRKLSLRKGNLILPSQQ